MVAIHKVFSIRVGLKLEIKGTFRQIIQICQCLIKLLEEWAGFKVQWVYHRKWGTEEIITNFTAKEFKKHLFRQTLISNEKNNDKIKN